MIRTEEPLQWSTFSITRSLLCQLSEVLMMVSVHTGSFALPFCCKKGKTELGDSFNDIKLGESLFLLWTLVIQGNIIVIPNDFI